MLHLTQDVNLYGASTAALLLLWDAEDSVVQQLLKGAAVL
jgi:hypothetical protein